MALLDALADHGEAFAQALAGVPNDYVTGQHHDAALRSTGEADERAMQLIVFTLKQMAEDISDAGSPTELGRFDPGPIARRLRLSPARIMQLRNELGAPKRSGSSVASDSAPAASSPVRHRQQVGRATT